MALYRKLTVTEKMLEKAYTIIDSLKLQLREESDLNSNLLTIQGQLEDKIKSLIKDKKRLQERRKKVLRVAASHFELLTAGCKYIGGIIHPKDTREIIKEFSPYLEYDESPPLPPTEEEIKEEKKRYDRQRWKKRKLEKQLNKRYTPNEKEEENSEPIISCRAIEKPFICTYYV
jgi:hypothetical protein